MARKRLGGGKGKKGKKGKKAGYSSTGIAYPAPPSKMSPEDKARHDKYRAEEDFRTLERAEEVRGDKDRHGKAMDHGRERISAMHRIMNRAGAERMDRRAAAGGRR